MILFESDKARSEKAIIRKNYPKATQNRLARMVNEMLETPFYKVLGNPNR